MRESHGNGFVRQLETPTVNSTVTVDFVVVEFIRSGEIPAASESLLTAKLGSPLARFSLFPTTNSTYL
jgi:hypothetical protein